MYFCDNEVTKDYQTVAFYLSFVVYCGIKNKMLYLMNQIWNKQKNACITELEEAETLSFESYSVPEPP